MLLGRVLLVFSTFDGSPRSAEYTLGGEVDADASGSWHATLPGDESAPLEHLHHLVNTRCGDKEVPLYVRLGGRPAKAMDVLGDKGEVFELSRGGALRGVLCCRRARTLYTREDPIRACFNDQNSAVGELDSQLLRAIHRSLRHLPVLQAVCKRFRVE